MKPKQTAVQQFGRYLSLGMLLPISTLVGYAMGYYLDKFFGTRFLYIVFLLFGIASGLIQVIREVTKDPDAR